MSATNDFTKMMPGFDFLQSLMKNAGAGLPGLPGMTQWVSPTLDPDELDKRIGELRTVQFWLEQNARLLAATVQALEVQRLTLSTLKTMNLPLADISESLRIKLPDPPAPAPAPVPAPAPEPVAAAPAPAPSPEPAASAAPAPAVVDPMAWWGALTQQFTELAASAMKDVRADAAASAAAKAAPANRAAAATKVAQKAAKKPAKKAAGQAAKKASAKSAPQAAARAARRSAGG
jgi:hypothetical protein